MASRGTPGTTWNPSDHQQQLDYTKGAITAKILDLDTAKKLASTSTPKGALHNRAGTRPVAQIGTRPAASRTSPPMPYAADQLADARIKHLSRLINAPNVSEDDKRAAEARMQREFGIDGVIRAVRASKYQNRQLNQRLGNFAS